MAKKKKKQRQHPLICPYCHSIAILRPADEIYKDANDTETKMLYVCKNYPECNTYIRINPKTNKPIGVMANKELRTLRKEAHDRFDLIFKKGILSRQDAYKILATTLMIPMRDAHIGCFDEYRCKQTIKLANKILYQNKEKIKKKEGDEYGK